MSKIFHKFKYEGINDENYYCEELTDTKNGLEIKLSNKDKSSKILISFKDYIGYQNFDEGDKLEEQEKHPELSIEHSFFTSSNSSFLDWHKKQSHNMYENCKIFHFLISTPNDSIDILYTKEPIIKVQKD